MGSGKNKKDHWTRTSFFSIKYSSVTLSNKFYRFYTVEKLDLRLRTSNLSLIILINFVF